MGGGAGWTVFRFRGEAWYKRGGGVFETGLNSEDERMSRPWSYII